MLTRDELLCKEKLSLLLHNIRNRNRTFHRDGCPIPRKDAKLSTSLRKQGNVLYIQFQNDVNNNGSNSCAGVWNKYTESILYAPNNSEELALGYGNRSAIMFYVRAFKDCIIECDKAMSITSSDRLRFKLLCRKAESLYQLNRCVKDVCKEAIKLLDSLDLEATQKKYYRKQLHTLIDANNFMSVVISETPEKKNYADALLNFKRSQELPCASKSVAIQYNKQWGRYIVATEDIPAGKIIGIEDYFSTKYDYISYSCCNNCQKQIRLHNSVPCEHCVYNLYCSESCRKEAWEKYHQFQCCIIPFLNFIESIEGTSERAFKFLLLAVHQVGGIEQMKQQLLEIENVDDPRMKGFLDGIFQDGKLINFFCLEQCKEENLNDKTRFAYLENSCLCAYLLAKHTNFFGEKMNLLEAEMFLNEDILFTAALFLRFYYINHRNMNVITYLMDDQIASLEHFAPFGSLFNHSCDPNVKTASESRATYITRYPIKKGSQLFLSYDNNIFNHRDKESRQKYLQKKHYFTCNCLACTENWSSVCLPSLKYVLEVVPSLKTSLPVDTIKLLKSFQKYACVTEFKSKLVKKILYHLNLLSTYFTVYCEQYFVLLRCLDMQYTIALYNHKPSNAFVYICNSIFKM